MEVTLQLVLNVDHAEPYEVMRLLLQLLERMEVSGGDVSVESLVCLDVSP